MRKSAGHCEFAADPWGGAGSRARLLAALATLVLHVLAIAGAIVVGQMQVPPEDKKVERLTVIALHAAADHVAPPPSPGRSLRPIEQASQPTSALPAPEVAVRVAIAGGADPKASVPPASLPLAPAPTRAEAGHAEGVQSPLAVYQQALWRHIAARRPRGAQLVGTTVVRFRIDAMGALLSAEIAVPSGNPNLDKIALRGLRQAAPMPRPPEGIAATGLTFVLPVNFH